MPAFCRKANLCSNADCQSTMSLSNWTAIALFARVLEFIERHILGVEQTAVPGQEVVADRLMHVILPTAARSLRAGTGNDTAAVDALPSERVHQLFRPRW